MHCATLLWSLRSSSWSYTIERLGRRRPADFGSVLIQEHLCGLASILYAVAVINLLSESSSSTLKLTHNAQHKLVGGITSRQQRRLEKG